MASFRLCSVPMDGQCEGTFCDTFTILITTNYCRSSSNSILELPFTSELTHLNRYTKSGNAMQCRNWIGVPVIIDGIDLRYDVQHNEENRFVKEKIEFVRNDEYIEANPAEERLRERFIKNIINFFQLPSEYLPQMDHTFAEQCKRFIRNRKIIRNFRHFILFSSLGFQFYFQFTSHKWLQWIYSQFSIKLFV